MADKKLPALPDETKLTAIGAYILDGLSLREACILADYPTKHMDILMERSVTMQKFVEKKEIEFKHNNLKQIASDPRKNAMWLLETLRPDEFGSKKDKVPASNPNVLAFILQSVQQGTSGMAPATLVPAKKVQSSQGDAGTELSAPLMEENDRPEYNVDSALNAGAAGI